MTMSAPSTASSPRRGIPRWAKVTIITLLVVANLLALGAIWAVTTGQNLLSGAATNEEVVGVLTAPAGDSLTFLIVGSDTREGLDDLTNFGNFSGERGDAIMLVRLDPDDDSARILSIPRDLWVEIPGHGENRINAAYAFGGAPLMVETIQTSLGIPVNHYVEINFVGFMALIDELGGIQMTFDYPARDSSSGLDVEAGTHTLSGEQALAYARSRKYQEYQNGRWVSVDANDVGRTSRQQEVMAALMAKLRSPSSVIEAGQITTTLAQHMTIDGSLADASVGELAWRFRAVLTGGVDGSTLPVRSAQEGGRSVVHAVEPDASDMISDFLQGTEVVSDVVRVQVLNGNGVGGSAGRMSDLLQEAGFMVAAVGDAPTKDYAETTVLVPNGSSAGNVIVTELGFGVVMFGDVDNDYDAVVIVGADAS